MSSNYKFTGFTIDNFRVFGQPTSFDISPITILTGTNSSGKSSFTKALNLLTKSYKANGLRKLELMGNNLHLGGFNSIKHFTSKDDKITFCFEGIVRRASKDKIFDNYSITLIYKIDGLFSVKVFKNKELILSFKIDKNKMLETFIKLPVEIIDTRRLSDYFKDIDEIENARVCNTIMKFLQNNQDAHTYSTERQVIGTFDDNIINTAVREIFKSLQSIGTKYTDSVIDGGEVLEVEFDYDINPRIKDVFEDSNLYFNDKSLGEIFLKEFLNLEVLKNYELFPREILTGLFGRLIFIDGVRAKQDLVYTPENSPNFFPVLDQYYNSTHKNYLDLKKWLVDDFKLIKSEKATELTDLLRVQQIEGYGYVIEFIKGKEKIDLSRVGYGVTQLLPILINVALNPKAIFVIEEPESNLHPALQSKLADFFVSAIQNKYDDLRIGQTQFIIETHSEYIVRKLQYLTASPKSQLQKDDTVIYYFYHPDNIPPGEDQIKKIKILDNGTLSDDFGTGFFDESDKISLSLWSMTNSQNN